MNKWPNFFIVGAARAGTTSLYQYLRQHPDIFMPRIKEPHFFSQVAPESESLRYLSMKVIADEEAYLKLFEEARGEVALGEASPSYLWSEQAPARIKKRIPDAKIIILLREPVDRAYSHYLADVREGAQRLPFCQAIEEDLARSSQTWGSGRLYVALGLYAAQVERYLKTFGHEGVHIYLYDDLKADPATIVSKTCSFISVPFDDGRFFDPAERFNTYAAPRNGLARRLVGTSTLRSLAISLLPAPLLISLRKRLLLVERPKPPMDPQAQALLASIYRDDVRRLEQVIARDLSHWTAAEDDMIRAASPAHLAASGCETRGHETQEVDRAA